MLPAVGRGLEGLLAVRTHVRAQVAVGGHVTPQAAAGGERGVAAQALVGLEARVGADVGLQHPRRGEALAALVALVRTLTRMRP